jgi:hypothetical protein
MEDDWARQDAKDNLPRLLLDQNILQLRKQMLERVLQELGPDSKPFDPVESDEQSDMAGDDRLWFGRYLEACQARRTRRLNNLVNKWPRIVFTKHFNLGGSHYAYTEAQSDAQAERNFQPGAALCLLEFVGTRGTVHTLFSDPEGVIRDPDVSWDGRRILFSWKKSDRLDDYHLYEMEVVSGSVRQLTAGLGFADYEGCYLSNGDLLFNSTRCVQTVDCWWTEVSNFYICNPDGRYLRRLTFDQVHDNFPTVLEDGRVIYTRWDYNDRGQIYPQGLFQMRPDGTGQTEFYGNNSWFPTTILHARGIPGTETIVAILTGHHTYQSGKLAIIDPAKGRQENAGVQLIAPVRETPAERTDRYGQEGDQFAYPYPLSETECLVAYAPHGWKQPRFGIYLLTHDGRREWLASDPVLSCNQPVPLAARPQPPSYPSTVDYGQNQGLYYLQNIYAGPGLAGLPRGSIKKLRVVALDFRAAGIGENRSQGEAGAALSSTPISIGNGAWDPKIILGEATVREDGSALFAAPARQPVYFQAMDSNGYAVQTMRSWTTLQPGETASCVGCHESKNSAPPPDLLAQSLALGVERLEGFYGPPLGFSYPKEIQPIWDRHCVRCHCLPVLLDGQVPRSTEALAASPPEDAAFTLRGTEVLDHTAKRKWSESYLVLTRSAPRSIVGGPRSYTGQTNEWVNWISVQSGPPLRPPYSTGAARSGLIRLLRTGHKDVQLSREEMDKIAAWIDLLVPFCGEYTEANAWTTEETQKYEHFLKKRRGMEAFELHNIAELLAGQNEGGRPGRNR